MLMRIVIPGLYPLEIENSQSPQFTHFDGEGNIGDGVLGTAELLELGSIHIALPFHTKANL